MLVRLDGVTYLSVGPAGFTLVSCGHNGSVRFRDILGSGACVQDINAHRGKAREGMLVVEFHKSLPFVASAGADGLLSSTRGRCRFLGIPSRARGFYRVLAFVLVDSFFYDPSTTRLIASHAPFWSHPHTSPDALLTVLIGVVFIGKLPFLKRGSQFL